MRARASASIAAVLLLVAASSPAPLHGQAVQQPPRGLGTDPDRDALQATIDRLARDSKGRLGVGIELLESGESLIVNGDFHYPMQSVYKLPIAMAVLSDVDAGRLRLGQIVEVRPQDFVSPGQHSPLRDANPQGTSVTIRQLLRLAIAESDGTASDVALHLVGGPERVMTYLQRIGVGELVVATTEQAIGADPRVQFRNWTTPRGSLSLLRAVYEARALSPTSRALVLEWLVEGKRGVRRLRGLLPLGTTVAHKTGSSGTIDGVTAATNDIGIVTLPDGRHLAVAVLLANSRGGDAARDGVIAYVAKAAWEAWTGGSPTLPGLAPLR